MTDDTFPHDPARFTPQMAMQNFAGNAGITLAEMGIAPLVVLSWSRKLLADFAGRIGAPTALHWPYGERNPLYSGVLNGKPVSFLQAPVGAPGTVMMMEELIACGAHTILGLGWAGSLQPHAPVGSFLLPTRCIREEGTSFHYDPDPAAEIVPDAALLEKLLQAAQAEGVQPIIGLHWTTDAPYRETLAKLADYRQQQGILGVDMETSAMYVLGRYRGVRVANLLVVSDELWQEWKPAFRTPELAQASATALGIIARCITDGGF